MTAQDDAHRRRANFFKGTIDPHPPQSVPPRPQSMHVTVAYDRPQRSEPAIDGPYREALETEALSLVRKSLIEKAHSVGLAKIPDGDLDHMTAQAQATLRGLRTDQLAAISPSSPLLQSLTDRSFTAVMTTEAQQRAAQLAAADPSSALTRDGHLHQLARFAMLRDGVDGSGTRGASGERLAGIGGERLTPEVMRIMESARHEAVRLGVPWAINQPDLLKLGPAAIKSIAQVQIDKQTYQRLQTDGRFEAKDVVVLADYAKAKGITDARPLANATADLVQRGKDEAEQLRIKQVTLDYMQAATAAAAKPNDPAAQQRLDQAAAQRREVIAPIAARSPEDYKIVQKQEDEMRMREQDRVTAATREATAVVEQTKTQAVESKVGVSGAKVEDGFADLAAPSPAASVKAETPQAKAAAPAEAKAAPAPAATPPAKAAPAPTPK